MKKNKGRLVEHRFAYDGYVWAYTVIDHGHGWKPDETGACWTRISADAPDAPNAVLTVADEERFISIAAIDFSRRDAHDFAEHKLALRTASIILAGLPPVEGLLTKAVVERMREALAEITPKRGGRRMLRKGGRP